MPIPPLEAPKPGTDLSDLPRCDCGSQIGLLPWNHRYWCPVCLTNEIERLREFAKRVPHCLGVKGSRVPVLPGDDCWRVIAGKARCGFVVWSHNTKPYAFFTFKTDKGSWAPIHKRELPVEDCFDSREAAEAGGE